MGLGPINSNWLATGQLGTNFSFLRCDSLTDSNMITLQLSRFIPECTAVNINPIALEIVIDWRKMAPDLRCFPYYSTV